MKKVLCAIIAVSLVLGAALAVHADNSVTVDTVKVNGANVEVGFNTSGLNADDQVTILTLQDTNPAAAATSSNIKYIDQIDKGTNSSISFALASAASGTYQIKMGGTDVATPSIMSITVDSGMSGDTYFAPNTLNLFAQKLTAADSKTDENGDLFILNANENYIAAYATAPARDGWTVKDYGVRLNGTDYEAKVSLTGTAAYGVLFHGSSITNNANVLIFPYVTYEKAGESDITYYGTTTIGTVTVE
jgi:hypothetical protein